MEETRSSLAEKLEVLEQKVADTVQEATSAVTDTVETVKETVTGTVESVKETVESTVEKVRDTLDLRCQVDRHPWPMVGGSFALGFLGGILLGPSSRGQSLLGGFTGRQPQPGFKAHQPASYPWTPSGTQAESRTEALSRQPGWWDQLVSAFGSEIDKLKGLAIGTLGGAIRDLVAQSVPENFRPTLTDVVNDLTTKLGGQTIHGRVLPEAEHAETSQTGRHTSTYA
jgi:ElaB/YqjD/DUF883 family membrane-anchored ribosome-binding protein